MLTFIYGVICIGVFLLFAPVCMVEMEKQPPSYFMPSLVFASGFCGLWFMLSTFTDIEPPFGIGYKEKDVEFYYNHLAEAQQKELSCRGKPNQTNECYSARAALRRFNSGS